MLIMVVFLVIKTRPTSLSLVLRRTNPLESADAATAITGQVFFVHKDKFSSKKSGLDGIIIDPTGSVYNVSGLSFGKNVTNGTSVTIQGATLTGDRLTKTSTTKITTSSSPATNNLVTSATGSYQIEVYPMYFKDSSSKPPFNKSKIEDRLKDLQDFFKEVSYSTVSISYTMRDWVEMPGMLTKDMCSSYGKALTANILKNTIRLIVFPENDSCDWEGMALSTARDKIGGTVFINGDATKHAYSHEFGHLLGKFGHANTLSCGTQSIIDYAKCSASDNYGDLADTMGLSYQLHFNGAFKAVAGYGGSDAVQQITKSGDYTLNMLEKNNAKPITLQISKPDTFESYYLTYKTRTGRDDYEPIPSGGAAYLHILSNLLTEGDRGNGTKPTFLLDVTPNDKNINKAYFSDKVAFCDAKNKIQIKQISHTASTVKFNVDLNSACGTYSSSSDTSCPTCTAKEMLDSAVNTCYGTSGSDRAGCDLMSTALNATYGPCSVCQSRQNQCTNGSSSGICVAAYSLQKVVDWCYNIMASDPAKAQKSGVDGTFCNNLSKATAVTHEDCNYCAPQPTSPPSSSTNVDIGGYVVDTNGYGLPNVKVTVEGIGAAGYQKAYYPITRSNGTWVQGGFIVNGGMYNVKLDGVAKTLTDVNVYDYTNKIDIPVGSAAYMNQRAGSYDCSSGHGRDLRCNFIYRRPLDTPGSVIDVAMFLYEPSGTTAGKHKLRKTFLATDGRTLYSKNCEFLDALGYTYGCDSSYTRYTIDTPLPVVGYSVEKYSSNAKPKIRQVYVANDQTTLYFRVCDFNNDTGQASNCSGFSTISMASVGKVKGVSHYLAPGNKMVGAYISADGTKMYTIVCDYDTYMNSSTGCGSYKTQSISGGTMAGYGSFLFKDPANRTRVQQWYIGDDGETPYLRNCVLNSADSLSCPAFF